MRFELSGVNCGTMAFHVLFASYHISLPLYAKQRQNNHSVFFRAGRLDPVLICHRFRKVVIFTVHKETRKRRFQKNTTLDRAFSESCVSGDRFHRISVDGRRIRNEKVAF